MDLSLSTDEAHIQEAIRAFVAATVAPNAAAWTHACALPAAVIRQVADLGIFGIVVPEAADGVGLGAVATAVVAEAVAHGDGSLALTIVQHASACRALALGGASSQVTETLRRCATGEVIATWAGCPGGVTATASGAGWSLSGALRCLPLALSADVAVFVASTEKGAGLFLLELHQAATAVSARVETLGMHAVLFGDVDLSAVPAAAVRRVDEGETPSGSRLDVARIVAFAQTALAAVAVGLGQAALQHAASYALERKQFGRPIAEFPAIQHKLADSATALEGAQLLTWRAAALGDSGRSARGEAAMARVRAADAARLATDEAIQIHGGYGYTREYPAERLWRDAKWCTVAGGTLRSERDALAATLLSP